MKLIFQLITNFIQNYLFFLIKKYYLFLSWQVKCKDYGYLEKQLMIPILKKMKIINLLLKNYNKQRWKIKKGQRS